MSNSAAGPSVPEAWLATQIVRGVHDAVVFADRAGRIAYWNAGAEAMFGYGSEEAIGQTLELIIPDRLRSRHNEGYERVMNTGETKYGTELLKVPALRYDGSTISIEFRVVLVGGPPPIGVAAVIREVTAEWEERRTLLRRLAEAESRLKEVQAETEMDR